MMLYLNSILTPLSLGPQFRQFDLITGCPWDIRNRDLIIQRLASRLASPRDRITKFCQDGMMDTLNSCLEASKGDRRQAPGIAKIGVCIRSLEVKVEPTNKDDRQAVFIEFDDTYETRLKLTCSA